MELRPLMTLRATLETPVNFGPGQIGNRIFFGVKSGTVDGERLSADLLPGGGDWLVVGEPGWGRLDIRAQIRTHDGAPIYLSYSGWLEINAKVEAALASGDETEHTDQYYRVAAMFETGDERYAWLNRIIALGKGRIINRGVEVTFFEVW